MLRTCYSCVACVRVAFGLSVCYVCVLLLPQKIYKGLTRAKQRAPHPLARVHRAHFQWVPLRG